MWEDPRRVADALFPPAFVEARARYRAFMDEHVYPHEAAIEREDDESFALRRELRGRAREAGLWAPHVPPEAGGTGLGFLYYACLNEEIGRSLYAQLLFGCQAPMRGTRRSSTSSAPTPRRSASSGRSSPARAARSSR